MNKENISVTLSLAEFDNLRSSEKALSNMYDRLKNQLMQLMQCFSFDTEEYKAELKRIDASDLSTDQQIHKAVKAAEQLIVVKVDMDKIKKLAVDFEFYDEGIDRENVTVIPSNKKRRCKP